MQVVWTEHAKKRFGERRGEVRLDDIERGLENEDYTWVVPGEEIQVLGERLIVSQVNGVWCVITYLGSHTYIEDTDFSLIRRWDRHQRMMDMNKSPYLRRRSG
jgi:hypothetical protein